MQVNKHFSLYWQHSHPHLQKTDWLDFLNIDFILVWTLSQFIHCMFFGSIGTYTQLKHNLWLRAIQQKMSCLGNLICMCIDVSIILADAMKSKNQFPGIPNIFINSILHEPNIFCPK